MTKVVFNSQSFILELSRTLSRSNATGSARAEEEDPLQELVQAKYEIGRSFRQSLTEAICSVYMNRAGLETSTVRKNSATGASMRLKKDELDEGTINKNFE